MTGRVLLHSVSLFSVMSSAFPHFIDDCFGLMDQFIPLISMPSPTEDLGKASRISKSQHSIRHSLISSTVPVIGGIFSFFSQRLKRCIQINFSFKQRPTSDIRWVNHDFNVRFLELAFPLVLMQVKISCIQCF